MASYQSVVNINIIMKFLIGHIAFVSLCTLSHCRLLSLTCLFALTGDLRLYFPSEGSRTQDFYAQKNPRLGLKTRTSDPVANMITTGPPGSNTGMGINWLRFQVLTYLQELTLYSVAAGIENQVYAVRSYKRAKKETNF